MATVHPSGSHLVTFAALDFASPVATVVDEEEEECDEAESALPEPKPPKMTGPRSQFLATLYSKRAWCHWGVGFGGEEGDIVPGVEGVLAILADEANGLPALEGCPVVRGSGGGGATSALCPGHSAGPYFAAVSEATAAKYSASMKVSVAAAVWAPGEGGNTVNGKPFSEFAATATEKGRTVILVVDLADLECDPSECASVLTSFEFVLQSLPLSTRKPCLSVRRCSCLRVHLTMYPRCHERWKG